MTVLLRQSTAVTVSFGPAVLNTDGVTYVSNLTGTGSNQTENTSTGIRIAKNGGALAARHASAGASNYDAFGMYLVPLDTTDTGTVGVLRVTYGNAAAFCPIFQDYMVLPANVYDSLVAGSDALDVSLIQWLGTAPLALSSQQVQAIVPNTQKVDVDTIKTNPVVNAGTITFPTTATLASTTNITAGTITTVGTVTTVTGLTASNLDATVSSRLATSSYTAPDNTSVAAIKVKTDQMVFTVANQLDANAESMNATTILGNGTSGNLWRG